jgi:FkbM family methyltransferase
MERTVTVIQRYLTNKAAAVLDSARPRYGIGGTVHEVWRKCLFEFLWPMIQNGRPCFDFEIEINGIRFSGNTEDTIPALLYYLGMTEDNLTYWFEEQLRPGDIFVDVGAHIGYFSLLEAKNVGASGGVVAIEALPRTFSLLERNIRLNPDLQPRIRALNVCALDVEGTAEFFQAPDHHTGGSSIRMRRYGQAPVRIPAIPLAKALTPDEIAGMRLMKIDVEGAEFEAVDGLIPVLDHTRADFEIVVETAHDWEYDGRLACVVDMINIFARHGFHAYGMKKQAYVSRKWHGRPVRIGSDPSWGAFDLVFSRRNQESI